MTSDSPGLCYADLHQQKLRQHQEAGDAALAQRLQLELACNRKPPRVPKAAQPKSRLCSKEARLNRSKTGAQPWCICPLGLASMRCFCIYAAYSGPLAQGDVVFLQSLGSNLPYIAMIERCDGPQLLCRWFYRYSELPCMLRSAVKPEDGELYLSTHKDENTRESVLGICHVVTEFSQGEQNGDSHLCRYTFNIQKQILLPLHTAVWTVRGSSKLAAAPGVPLHAEAANGKKRRCKFPLVRLVCQLESKAAVLG